MVGPVLPARQVAAALLAASLAVGPPAACSSDSEPYVAADCERAELGDRSVARVWDETLLGLIRDVTPAPTVHARNLFHVSAAMWDAWAAFDPTADGYFVDEQQATDDPTSDREAALSFAAYRILLWRYATVSDLPTATERLDAVMASMCYRTDYESTDGDTPADLGNRIASAVVDGAADDGALEDVRYQDSSYVPINEPMVVADPGTRMADPNAWQPLSLGTQIAQNGLPIPGEVQTYIGPHWGFVETFALDPSPTGTPIDPGPPPRFGDPETDAAFRQAAIDVIRYGAALDPESGDTIDIAPSSLGNNTLGTDDGSGYDVNPATGDPYQGQRVLVADFGRSIAEYWADGPDSETPPGHWNLIANTVQDAPGFERRIGGDGPPVDRLEWDVKTYFALNGALHDAAVAAWGAKRFYDSPRPISMIRFLGGNGQSSDPGGPSYDPDGLPLVPGLIELVSPGSSAAGQRHEHLRDHVGEVVVRGWRGGPDDPETQVSGVGWVRAVDWVPYQRPTFVSPAFAGYVSGHSTFSRAGAEVMTAITGSAFFPGGISKHTIGAGELLHEDGPTADVTLQWATYYDAADQAGVSRLHGGIHIEADDLAGRVMGARCGTEAWALAQMHFDGSIRP